MAETLYRKYRPQTFADIVDQQHVKITLQQALAQDKLAHAYLFAGPRGVGKTTMARLLARAANCPKRQADGEPCNRCPSCLTILEGRSLDLVEIDAASQTGVDNVRENVIQSARSIPALATYKVFIIDEVHMLSLAAFNALLKLLEEPPSHAMFILATTEVHRIPETIISRTQRFDFKKINIPDLVSRLQLLANREKKELAAGVAERIARTAGGSLRDAESTLGQLFSFPDKEITHVLADLVMPRSDAVLLEELLGMLVRRQTSQALALFHKFCDEGGDIPVLVHELIRLTRGLLFAVIDQKLAAEILNDEDPQTVQSLLKVSQESSVPALTTMMEELLQAERDLSQAVMMELPVEVAIIKMTSPELSSAGPSSPPVVMNTGHTISTVPPASMPSKTSKIKKNLSSQSLALSTLEQAWRDVQVQLTKTQPSLALSMRSAHVTGWVGDHLQVAVPFALHRDRLQDSKGHDVVVAEMERRLQVAVKMEITIAPDDVWPAVSSPASPPAIPSDPGIQKPPPAVTGDLWDQVVASFGTVPK